MKVDIVAAALLGILAMLDPGAAQAVYLSESGDKATLYGPIDPGDDKVFAEFLGRPRAAPIRVLYLDSYEGAIEPAVLIARMVRKAKLATALDAPSRNCVSACTLIFAGGVKRHNIHGEQIEEGVSSRSGLGYHRASFKSNAVFFGNSSDRGNETMAKLYAEMGTPAAAQLLYKGRGSFVYRPSGANSLALKIATSLAEP